MMRFDDEYRVPPLPFRKLVGADSLKITFYLETLRWHSCC